MLSRFDIQSKDGRTYIATHDERRFHAAFSKPVAEVAIGSTNKRAKTMTRFLKSSFLWQFAGGFVLGAVGLFALTPVTDPVTGAPIEQVR